MVRLLVTTLTLLLAFPLSTFAHKVWLLPSQTVFSGVEPWLTVDAAVSNDLFYFNHFPLKLDNLVITAPNGAKVEPQNPSTLKYRSVFDVPLSQQGTYRIAVVNDGLFATFEQDGQRRRWSGTPEKFEAEVAKDAKNLQVSESVGRIETFVTNGAPTEKALETKGRGIELQPITHPNDLYVGDKGKFRLLLDGKPAAGLEVEIIRGESRYRNAPEEIHVKTDANGEFAVEWKQPGMYWLETTSSDEKTSLPQAKTRRLSYVATLEVLPQ